MIVFRARSSETRGIGRPLGVLLAGLTAAVSPLAAQEAPNGTSATDLRGIYVDSNAFPISKANETALTASLTVPGVDGLVLVLGWDGIEPSPGQYDWSTLDQWMTTAVSLGKKVELSISASTISSATGDFECRSRFRVAGRGFIGQRARDCAGADRGHAGRRVLVLLRR